MDTFDRSGRRPPAMPPRPEPRAGVAQRARRWIEWFGAGRLAATGLTVAAVGAGAFWLLRAPPAPPEASLPRATTSTIAGAATPAPDAPASARASAPSAVVVHVAGAVIAPGVYELRAGARVTEAITAAGGPAADGDPGALNLAAIVADGQRVYVPHVGESVAPDPQPPTAGGSAGPAAPVDVNSASAGELEALPGIGPATAAAIVRHREQNGPFASVDDLLDVPGIGPSKLDAFRSLVVV